MEIVFYSPVGRGSGVPIRTNHMGLATFHKVDSWVKGRKDRKTAVRVLMAAENPPEKSFDPLSPPREPIVLTLPPTGNVLVQVIGPDGLPRDGTMTVRLSPGREEKRGFFSEISLEAPVKGGKAVFHFVGLGLYLRLYPEFKVYSFGL